MKLTYCSVPFDLNPMKTHMWEKLYDEMSTEGGLWQENNHLSVGLLILLRSFITDIFQSSTQWSCEWLFVVT